MNTQISIRHVEQFLEFVERQRVIHRQRADDARAGCVRESSDQDSPRRIPQAGRSRRYVAIYLPASRAQLLT